MECPLRALFCFGGDVDCGGDRWDDTNLETNYTKVIRPNIVNEAQFGYRMLGEIL